MKVLRHQDTPPSINFDIPQHVNGLASNRRVLSKLRGGPDNIDVDYNQYAGGLGHSNAYAYPLGEFAYVPSGELLLVSDGEKKILSPGSFVLRPARAQTEQIAFITDCVTICAFGPAREVDLGYQLPQDEIGVWDPALGPKPCVTTFHFSQIEPVDLPGGPTDGSTVYRPVLNPEGIGPHAMSMSHTTLRKGALVRPPLAPRTVVIWLESGRLQAIRGQDALELSPEEFLYFDPNDFPDILIAMENSVYITWSAPI